MLLQKRKFRELGVFLIYDDIYDYFLSGVGPLIQMRKFIISNRLENLLIRQKLIFEKIRTLFLIIAEYVQNQIAE